jgi:hypothetical protein
MSSYYGNYSQYLGAQKCCSLKTQGPQGPAGPTGPAAVGQIGYTGPTGASQGYSYYTAYATYGQNSNPLSTPFYLIEDANNNQFYSQLSPALLIGIPITLPAAGKIWNINVSIVETGLKIDGVPTLEEDSTFNIRFYTAFDASAGFTGTSKAPYCFNGNSSYIINSSDVSVRRMAASNSDILDLSGTTETTWYIQLNQYNPTVVGALYGNFKFCITMNSLN